MKWENALAIVRDEPVFTTGMLLAGSKSAANFRSQLCRWVESGKILQLRRGVYSLAPPYAQREPHPFLIANRLEQASYVSLQSALSYHGMIPEHVPITTSITTRRTEHVSTALGRFEYRHVQPLWFAGFQRREVSPGQWAIVATPEKALLDLLYLTPGSDSYDYLRELRLQMPPRFDWSNLHRMAEPLRGGKLRRAAHRLDDLLAISPAAV